MMLVNVQVYRAIEKNRESVTHTHKTSSYLGIINIKFIVEDNLSSKKTLAFRHLNAK